MRTKLTLTNFHFVHEILDLPLHPFSSPSYTSLSANSRAVSNHPIHNSHRTDALRGVFKAHFKNASTPHQDSQETEFNSSRLKRQLDFGSDEDDAKKDSTPKAGGVVVPTNQPLLRVLQIGTKIPTIPTSSSASSSFPPSPSSSSSERSENSPPSPKFRKRLHRFKPPQKNSEEENKYEVDGDPEDRKNFTLEVVQVERKVVRKEDGHIPSLFSKPNFKTIEPRLLQVSDAPSVVYKKGARPSSAERPRQYFGRHRSSTEASSEETSIAASEEDRNRDNSDEKQVVINLNQQIPLDDQEISEEDLKDYNDGHATFGTKGNFTHSIISRNVAGFIPNNPQTGNKNELRKRSQRIEPYYASKKRGDGRKIVIEKGKVTEKYPENPDNPFKDPKSDIYAVPGGRSGSEEEEEDQPQQQVFKFTRNKKHGGNHPKNDLTSPAIPTSLEELYRKGHPGVLPAPRNKDSHLLDSEPYGDSGEYRPSSFRADPLEDDPPLKFDPESDRFYGEPIPDNKEKLAQPNSPIRVENRRSTDAAVNRNGEFQEFFSPPPPKRGRAANSQEEDSSSRESPTKNPDAFISSRELPARSPPGRFNYGRAYNPPEYSNDYDTADQVEQGDNPETNDSGLYDFVGLEENYGAGAPAEDDFDYGGGFAPSSFKPRAGDDRNQEVVENNGDGGRSNEDDERETTPRARNPPRRAPSKASNEDVEYDNNGRESDYGFGPAGTEEGANDAYDPGFINTLKQFDEEIKKLQHQERNKLLHSTPVPQQQQETPPPNIPVATPIAIPGSSDEYKDEPPLIISSPGPLPESETGGSPEGTTLRGPDDEPEEHTRPGPTEGSSEEVGDATQISMNPGDEDYQTERSKDYDDDTTSQSAEGEQSTQASSENGYEPLKRK
ncbi:hypothetical protein Ocin01_06056 [Orchesella cincta]|uniref:Uncharacterized protein n=1 Tax=Orchesella cincta TaxID=48709 RepID=A0A1D2N6B2_ORCCI|nr:hypothetical protein Ocin01_06056 [Orchesella cincta]